MASTSSTISIIFDGDVARLVGAARVATGALTGLARGVGATVAPLASLGAAGAAVATIGGVTGALTQLAPVALALPGALLLGAAAFGTLKLATAGFGEAVSAADPAAFAEATKDMAPAAVGAASALRELQRPLGEIRKEVQGKFFAGFETGIRDLGERYLPVLSEQLPRIASRLNLVGRGIFEAFSSNDAVSDFNGVLDGTADALSGLGPALGNIGVSILKLGSFGIQQFAGLGEGVDTLASKFQVFVSDGIESGSFQVFFDNAIQGFRDLGGIIGGVAEIAGTVFTALGGQVESPLAKVREITVALSDFLKTAEGQEPLIALGEVLATAGDTIQRVFLAGLRELGPLISELAPIVDTLAVVVGDILVGAFEQLGPPLTRLFAEYGPEIQAALGAIGDIVVSVVIPALANFVDFLIDVAIPGAIRFAGTMVAVSADAAIAVSGAVSTMLGFFADLFGVLARIPGPFQQAFGQAATSATDAKNKVDAFRGTMELVKSKAVELVLNSEADKRANDIKRAIEAIPNRRVTVTIDEVYGAKVRIQGQSGFVSERAAGGPVSAGRTYLVGEKGPELFTPGATGFITPNDRLSRTTPTLASAGTSTTAAPSVNVVVMIDGREFRGMIRTEITDADRETARDVRAGAGATF